MLTSKSKCIINLHPYYLHIDFVSGALQAGDLIGHLNRHVQGEIPTKEELYIEHSIWNAHLSVHHKKHYGERTHTVG